MFLKVMQNLSSAICKLGQLETFKFIWYYRQTLRADEQVNAQAKPRNCFVVLYLIIIGNFFCLYFFSVFGIYTERNSLQIFDNVHLNRKKGGVCKKEREEENEETF